MKILHFIDHKGEKEYIVLYTGNEGQPQDYLEDGYVLRDAIDLVETENNIGGLPLDRPLRPD